MEVLHAIGGSMNRLALVSGATGGIGAVVVKTLWHAGYSILALGYTITKVTALNNWFIDHKRQGQDAFALRLDLRDTDELWRIRTLLDTSLSLLVTCHGAAPAIGPSSHIGASALMRDVYETDVIGTFRLCQIAYPHMASKRHGSIVILSSLHAHATYPGRLPYAVSRASLVSMARSLAIEYGEYNIRVNSISPWQVSGERTDFFIKKELEESGDNLLDLYNAKSPLRRIVSPEDIAKTVIYLSENNSMTGTDIILDCGITSSMWYKQFS